MTSDEFPHSLAGRVVELAKVLGSIGIIVSFFTGIWAFTYGPVASFLDQWSRMQNSGGAGRGQGDPRGARPDLCVRASI